MPKASKNSPHFGESWGNRGNIIRLRQILQHHACQGVAGDDCRIGDGEAGCRGVAEDKRLVGSVPEKSNRPAPTHTATAWPNVAITRSTAETLAHSHWQL